MMGRPEGGASLRDYARILDELTQGVAAGGTLLLLTDYDGTLTPLVAEPEEAWLPAAVQTDLRLLAQSPRVRVGIISGRDLHDLRTRVGVPEVIYAGCHGLEVEGPSISFTHPEAEAQRQTLRAIAQSLSLRIASIPGARIEPKALSVAVHYRNAAPGTAGRLEILLERAIHQRRSRLRILRGKKVFEVLPRIRWNKGECALWIRDRIRAPLPSPVTMLYMGDDRTDELAFEVLAGKAITVKIGFERTRSAAAYRLPDAAEVQRLLSELAGAVGGKR
ncbi:MAG: trehalose-phosphatase [Candidatus Methylomirabilia bacterium]